MGTTQFDIDEFLAEFLKSASKDEIRAFTLFAYALQNTTDEQVQILKAANKGNAVKIALEIVRAYEGISVSELYEQYIERVVAENETEAL